MGYLWVIYVMNYFGDIWAIFVVFGYLGYFRASCEIWVIFGQFSAIMCHLRYLWIMCTT